MRRFVLATCLALAACGPSGGDAAAPDRSIGTDTHTRTDRAVGDVIRDHDRQVSASLTALTRANEEMQQTLAANQTQIAELQEARRRLTEIVRLADAGSPTDEGPRCLPPVTATDVENEKRELHRRLEELQRRLEKDVDLRGSSDGPTEAPPPDAGQVIAVDQSANVVVISLGAEDKLKPGFRYMVSRGDEYVGTIEIRTVVAKKSSARSLKDLQKSPIQVGDKVIPK